MPSVITGCLLVNEATEKAVWGDLHRIGQNFVLNACLSNGEAAWAPYPGDWQKEQRPAILLVRLTPEWSIFERRGVIIFPHMWVDYNDAAAERLK